MHQVSRNNARSLDQSVATIITCVFIYNSNYQQTFFEAFFETFFDSFTLLYSSRLFSYNPHCVRTFRQQGSWAVIAE